MVQQPGRPAPEAAGLDSQVAGDEGRGLITYPTCPPEDVLVIIPTYNEADNLATIISRVRYSCPDADVLIVDDSSPDGTGVQADALAAVDPHVFVLHRRQKDGLGRAYLDGFRWAFQRDYDIVVQLDADGSHQPEQLPRLLRVARDADVVIGSRWVTGGTVRNWPRHREALSRTANWYVRTALRLPVRDVTAGYRVYRVSALRRIDLDGVESTGYCFQVDLTRRAVRAGFLVSEEPIDFVERILGHSKMSTAVIGEALTRVARWAVTDRLGAPPSTSVGPLSLSRASNSR